MNQRTALFELGSILLLIVLGITLAFLSIDSTGVLSVAGLLSLIFITHHFKPMSGLSNVLAPDTAMSTAQNNSER